MKQPAPEAFDGYDCEPRKPLSAEYMKAALPEHLQQALAGEKPADQNAEKAD